MLPIRAWRIYYADGSSYSSVDGPWASAPAFGVQCVVYYHPPPYRTLDSGGDTGVYVYQGEGGETGQKMGLWMDTEGYYRIVKAAQGDVPPASLPETP